VVPETPAGDFMTFVKDHPNEVRVLLGSPPENKKGCLGRRFFKAFQDQGDSRLESGLEPFPMLTLDSLGKGTGLEIFFQVHREDMLLPPAVL
jgi:hypothetical protein